MRLFILVFCLVAVLSCTDIPDADLQLQPTEMRVRVVDENYVEVAGARVYIYRDYISFQTKTGEVAIDTTEADGYAHFTNLEPYNYFIYAVHNKGTEVHDNSVHYNNLFDYLTENAVTTVSVKTDYLWDGDPTLVTINSFDVIPRDLNKYWDGKEFDTLQGEFLVIRNYDYGLISDQDIVARTTYLMSGKVKYGVTQYVYPVDGSFDPLTLDLDDLQNSGDTYTLYISCFINQADFDNKDQIYAGLLSKTAYTEDEYFTNLGDRIVGSMTQDNPCPQLNYLDYTYSQKVNYLVYTNLTWE